MIAISASTRLLLSIPLGVSPVVYSFLLQEWDGLVRVAFVRKNKTLSAAFCR